ncbi:hypothetical protein VaNZ11_005445 [Volvox africanus]|uniref:Uncharacterized protein n=1 Tax=Volvox africanus TaxID=51714 RepID=A0ABQ5RZX2_9CHLO|nr:hypothetical protein VaNZ11_005445 [Volvox africanus]
MLGGWPYQNVNNCPAPKRTASHVNPLPVRKPSKRAKYGDGVETNKARRLARSSKAPVVRPKPRRALQYFQELIQRGEEGHRGGQQHEQQGGEEEEEEEENKQADQQAKQQQGHQGQQQQAHQTHQQQQGHLQPRKLQDGQQQQQGQLEPPGHQWNPEMSPSRDPSKSEARRESGDEKKIQIQYVYPRDEDPDLDPDPSTHPDLDLESDISAPTPTILGMVTPSPAGFHRRRKLFEDSPDGPYPRMTAKIVARLAACSHWRRPLAHRLLPKYLPLFDEHAAAYFFKHVPSLQPRPVMPPTSQAFEPSSLKITGGGGSPTARAGGALNRDGGATAVTSTASRRGSSSSSSSSDVAGFRRMVVAVCCSLLPKMPSFGPRALSCMIAGLGRMGIRHGPTLAAWEAQSASQLGLMRPDQLVASLEGLGALQRSKTISSVALGVHSAASTGGRHQRLRRRRPPPSSSSSSPLPLVVGDRWRLAALAAVHSALPHMTVAEVNRMLMALALLRLSPSMELLSEACTRVRNAVTAEAARLAAISGVGSFANANNDVHNGGGNSSDRGDGAVAAEVQQEQRLQTALLTIASALEESAAVARLATLYRHGMVGATGGAVGIVGTSASAASAASANARPCKGAGKPKGAGRSPKKQRVKAVQLPEPVRARDIAGVVKGLAALGYAPSRDWLDWLVRNVEVVLLAELKRTRQQPQQQTSPRGRSRRLVKADAAAAALSLLEGSIPAPLPVGAPGSAVATVEAMVGTPLPPYFSAADLAELMSGLADLTSVMLQPSAEMVSTSAELVGGGAAEGAPAAARPPVPPLPRPLPVPAEWLNLLLDAALEDLRRRLDPGSAVAAAAAAAAAAPTALLTQGDITKADATLVAAAFGTSNAAAVAAADAVPAASCLLEALMKLQPYYAPPRHWCMAAAALGLELVPYMQLSLLLLWLRSIAAWDVPRPLTPAWHAAAAVCSRTQLWYCTTKELLDLPGVFAAAGVRMPATWAAQYVRHLAFGLRGLRGIASSPSPDGARVKESVSPAWRRRERQLQLQNRSRPPSVRPSWRQCGDGISVGSSGDTIANIAGENADRRQQIGAEVESPEQGSMALHDVATALRWLPYIVPDLRYVAECEGDALQALARAFGLLLLQPLPLSWSSTSSPLQVSPPLSMISETTTAIPVPVGTLPAWSVSAGSATVAAPGVRSTGGRTQADHERMRELRRRPRTGVSRQRSAATTDMMSSPQAREAVRAFLGAAGISCAL